MTIKLHFLCLKDQKSRQAVKVWGKNFLFFFLNVVLVCYLNCIWEQEEGFKSSLSPVVFVIVASPSFQIVASPSFQIISNS